MNMGKLLLLFTTILLVFVSLALVAAPQSEVPQSPAQDGTLKALTAVAGAGALENNDYEYLREVSDDIGARVTGSPEAKKAIAPARSCGCPRRRIGIPRSIASSTFGCFSITPRNKAVSVGPGQTTLTVILLRASSRARVLEKAIIAALHPE